MKDTDGWIAFTSGHIDRAYLHTKFHQTVLMNHMTCEDDDYDQIETVELN